ncbi:hypothetical protein ASD80_14415 [Devosia sp. Root635]|nr:hypothetical protein ASD80_14415 [Devosia sp. Root635]
MIGASAYDDAAVPALEGAGNDANLLYATLSQRWTTSDNIRVLANGAALERLPFVAAAPTRAAILSALADLAEQSRPGDRVLIAMSGHGAQLPINDPENHPEEPDGLDEIFLPVDVALDRSEGGLTIRNHITDDEMAVAIGAILAQGASVWLVVDACHSGTFERGTVVQGQPRFLDLRSVGPVVDGNASAPRAEDASLPADGYMDIPVPPGSGGTFVGFYASQPGQKTIELPFPAGAGEPDRVYGVLSYSLAHAMADADSASFADLARSVSRVYWSLGGGLPDPMFVGNLGARAMEESPQSRRFAVAWTASNQLSVLGGALSGLEHGSAVAVHLGDDAEPLFHAEVTELGLDRAEIEVVAGDPLRPDRSAELMAIEGLDPQRHRALWLADRAPALWAEAASPPLRAAPLRISMAGDVDSGALLATDAVTLVSSGEPADLRLMSAAGEIVATPEPGTDLPTIPLSVSVDAIAPVVDRLVRGRAVFRLARLFSATEIGSDLSASVTLADAGGPSCGAANGDSRASAPGRTTIRPCDQVFVTLTNSGPTPLDISPFYLDPTGALYYLTGYPDGRFFGLRLPAGGSADFTYVETGLPEEARASAGNMYLLMLAVPASEGNAYPVDFRFLEAAAPLTGNQRAAPGDDFGALLAAAAYETGTTRSVPDAIAGGALVIPLRVAQP